MRRIVRLGFLLATAIPALPAAAQSVFAPIEAYAEVLDRPLFAADRRRHPPKPAIATGMAVLSGIVIHGSDRYAVFASEPSTIVRVREGQRIAAGMVLRIMPDRVVLARADGGEAELRLVPEAMPGIVPAVPPIKPTDPAVTASTTVMPETSVMRTTRPASSMNAAQH